MLSTVNAIVRRSWLLDTVRSLSLTSARCSNQNSDDGGDEKSKAKRKLNSLLESIISDDSLVKHDSPRQESAPRPKIREKKAKERTERNLGEQIVKAAKEVAQKIDGDQSKTEAELLGKVVARDEKLQKSVFKASGKTTLKLLLEELEVEKSKQKRPRSTLESMKEREERKGGFSRADMMRSGPPRYQQRWSGATVKGDSVDIFGGGPLGIFKPNNKYVSGPKLETWDQCNARELKLAFTHPPRNIWEQMIQWTDKGMLWKFPIDNEQGLEKEQEVSFVDHIFLDVHLEDWCPKRGPIRNYMDLVCIGLSRNHWLSVEEKVDHIMWYKEYFLSKKQLIKELGAGEFVDSEQSAAA